LIYSRREVHVAEFDLSGVKTYPLASRKSKANAADFAKPFKDGAGAALLESFPSILGAADLKAVAAALVFVTACGAGPTQPGTNNTDIVSLQVVCPGSLLVGQTVFCAAVAQSRGGSSSTVTPSSSWSSSDPAVASMGPAGAVTGRAAGKAVASASYLGQSGSAQVSVEAQDVLRVEASAQQGTFRVGNSVTMWLQGFYGVASADTGQLSLVITSQNGAVVSTSGPQTVARGGDSFILSSRFTIPAGSTQVCRTAVLQIGSVVISASGASGLQPCIGVIQ
jgi:hypothetical protein